MKTKLPVIFRKWSDGDVIAMFPTVPSDYVGNYCQSYSHIGQHGGADQGIVNETKPASRSEYYDLLLELKRIGYKNLKVMKRFTRKHAEIRKKQSASASL